MRKVISLPFKAVRRASVLACGLILAGVIKLTDRFEFTHWPLVTEALGVVPFTFGWQLREEVYRRLGVCRGRGTISTTGRLSATAARPLAKSGTRAGIRRR